MTTHKKKHLIELMIEAGVKWPVGAEYAAQDKRDLNVNFYRNGKPNMPKGEDEWLFNHCNFMSLCGLVLPSLCRKWNKTIVTREQYAEALAANVGEPAVMASKSNQVRKSDDVPAVDSVEWHNPPSIEQLAADYHAKAAEADRLQAVADEAMKAADDALIALEKAGELIGLVISIDTKPKQVGHLDITDWRDLRVGDVVEHLEHHGGNARVGSHGVVSEALDYCIIVDYPEHNGYVYSVPECQHKFRFIRRP